MRFMERFCAIGGWVCFLALAWVVLFDGSTERASEVYPAVVQMAGDFCQKIPVIWGSFVQLCIEYWQLATIAVLSFGPITSAVRYLRTHAGWLLKPPCPMINALYWRARSELGNDKHSTKAWLISCEVVGAMEECEELTQQSRRFIATIIIFDALAEQREQMRHSLQSSVN